MARGEEFMLMAIKEARKNIKSMDGGPFGACIVKGGEILAIARNTVLRNDATCHAEVNAIRKASKKLGTYDLSGAVIYSTTEPCPMCFSAIHWAKIRKVFYGTTTKDAKKIGFNELLISDSKLKSMGGSSVELRPDFLHKECLKLMNDWASTPGAALY